jgi:hypothetical protein
MKWLTIVTLIVVYPLVVTRATAPLLLLLPFSLLFLY